MMFAAEEICGGDGDGEDEPIGDGDRRCRLSMCEGEGGDDVIIGIGEVTGEHTTEVGEECGRMVVECSWGMTSSALELPRSPCSGRKHVGETARLDRNGMAIA